MDSINLASAVNGADAIARLIKAQVDSGKLPVIGAEEAGDSIVLGILAVKLIDAGIPIGYIGHTLATTVSVMAAERAKAAEEPAPEDEIDEDKVVFRYTDTDGERWVFTKVS